MRQRGWIWIAISIVLVGFWLRLPGVARGLPYIHNVDESNFYMRANDERGLLDAGWRNDWLRGYPPGYIWFYAGALTGLDWISDNNIHTDMSKFVGIMRLVNVLGDIITLVLMMRVVTWLAGQRAGLLVGLVYALSAAVLDTVNLGLSDPLMVLWCALCMTLTIHAFRRDRWQSALLATAAGLLAVTFKYSVFAVLLMPAAYFLLFLWRRRARGLLPAALALGMVLMVVYGLLFIYGGTNLEINEAKNFRASFIDNTLTPIRWQYTLNGLLGTIGLGMLLVSVVGIARLLRRKMTPAIWLGLLILGTGLAILSIIPGYLAYLESRAYPVRYTLPAAMLVLTGLAALAGQTLLRQPRPRWQMIVIFALPVLTLLPDIASYWTISHTPYSFAIAQTWFEENIPEGSLIWMESAEAYTSLSRYDKGYSGFKSFPAYFAQDYINRASEVDFDEVAYFFLTEDDIGRWSAVSGWQPLNVYPLIKHIGGAEMLKPDLYIYSAKPMPNPQQTAFVNPSGTRIVLRGMNITPAETQVSVESYWQADETQPSVDYSYTIYLTPADDPANVLAQRDGQLGHRATSSWYDPEEILRGEIAPLDLPADLAAGDYTVWLAIYYWETGERLLLDDGTNALNIYDFSR
jgi:hypothetical protein